MGFWDFIGIAAVLFALWSYVWVNYPVTTPDPSPPPGFRDLAALDVRDLRIWHDHACGVTDGNGGVRQGRGTYAFFVCSCAYCEGVRHHLGLKIAAKWKTKGIPQ